MWHRTFSRIFQHNVNKKQLAVFFYFRGAHVSTPKSAPLVVLDDCLDPLIRCRFACTYSITAFGALSSYPKRLVGLQRAGYAKLAGSDVKIGQIIERKGRMQQVVKVQHTQHGRGGATIQLELRDVQSGMKSTERLRTSEYVERVYADDKKFSVLYCDTESAVLMEPQTYEQMSIPLSLFGQAASYLTDGMEVTAHFFDGAVLTASVPPRVTCSVAEAEPYFKGQTAAAVYKKAVLSNGLQVQVPSFVVAGDSVVIDTSDSTYVTRMKTE